MQDRIRVGYANREAFNTELSRLFLCAFNLTIALNYLLQENCPNLIRAATTGGAIYYTYVQINDNFGVRPLPRLIAQNPGQNQFILFANNREFKITIAEIGVTMMFLIEALGKTIANSLIGTNFSVSTGLLIMCALTGVILELARRGKLENPVELVPQLNRHRRGMEPG